MIPVDPVAQFRSTLSPEEAAQFAEMERKQGENPFMCKSYAGGLLFTITFIVLNLLGAYGVIPDATLLASLNLGLAAIVTVVVMVTIDTETTCQKVALFVSTLLILSLFIGMNIAHFCESGNSVYALAMHNIYVAEIPMAGLLVLPMLRNVEYSCE